MSTDFMRRHQQQDDADGEARSNEAAVESEQDETADGAALTYGYTVPQGTVTDPDADAALDDADAESSVEDGVDDGLDSRVDSGPDSGLDPDLDPEMRGRDGDADEYATGTGYQTPGTDGVDAVDDDEHEAGYGLGDPMTPEQTTDDDLAADADLMPDAAGGAVDDDDMATGFGAAPGTPAADAPAADTLGGALGDTVMTSEQATAFHDRLHEIQASFIDDPRQAAQDADGLLAEVAREFCAGLDERRRLLGSAAEGETDGGSGTEDLRLAMQQYRGLVDSLLSC
jgi:hypothetical protein